MRAICVDDDRPVLEETAALCGSLGQITEVTAFSRPEEAMAWLETHPVELALLDIHMPGIDGFAVAEKVKQKNPGAAVVFVTAFPEHAVRAFRVRAAGYLLKPVSREALAEEAAYACSLRPPAPVSRITVRTFGSFEILVDGNTLSFRRARSKELLAFLVDQNGSGVTRPAIFAALWEEGLYDRPKQKYLDTVIRSLRDTLRAAGVGDILEIRGGYLRIRPERLDCDLYRFLKGETAARCAYRGEYMKEYSWAVLNTNSLY